MKKYKAIIYDIDATILDTVRQNTCTLMQIIKEELGIDMPYEEAALFMTNPGQRTLKLLGIKDIDTAYARWVRYVNEFEEGATLYEGFETVLETFQKSGILQGIVSSKMHPQYQIDFVSKGLDRYIATAVLMEDTPHHKPDPMPMLECLRRLGIEAQDAIYIGDTPADELAARNSGMDFGYAKWGSVFPEERFHPDYVFEKPVDLLKLLED